MKLCQHPDFEQAILQAAEHFRARGISAALIEKDYYVTEALRVITTTCGDKVIFKGGTSLSKGWNLIQRFSEDIDLFLDPLAFNPPLGAKAINRELKRLRDTVAQHPGLTFLTDESKTIGGFGRMDRFAFTQHFGGIGSIANRVLIESGTASGREPTERRMLQSFVGQFLDENRQTLSTDDEIPFSMRLLHFRRTFIEKMFAIHGKVELLKRDNRRIGGYARHYYDLYQLAGQAEVHAMLRSDEYEQIKADYDLISRTHFARDYFPPVGMTFSDSDALFPPAELVAVLSQDYEEQCRILCYGAAPSWSEIMARLENIRSLL
ncbi:MAG: nucleotidyl transferase AbiEii/AbiGii toxin family protein [Planctomycetes bacterium]|nr:nucleotidyl transferase AbiEii/AbiGii toxin family protein [Planctomycetota bacterium]